MFVLLSEVFVGLFAVLLALAVSFIKWRYSYWKRRNVPYLEPKLPFGNFSESLRGEKFEGFITKAIYDEMKSKGWKYGGVYKLNKTLFIPVDLEIIKNVLIKDFRYFPDHDHYVNEKDKLQAHLLNLRGDKWKSMRSKLTPTFSSGKIKAMFEVMAQSQTKLDEKIYEGFLKKEPIDVKDVCAGFTTNIIASCAFGLEVDALSTSSTDVNYFRRNLFPTNTYLNFKRMFSALFPSAAKLLNVCTQTKESVAFITNMVQGTIDYRKKNNYTRNDLMQLLIDMMDNSNLTFDEVASQAQVFFAAGFETSSSLMMFALYELAKHQDVQDRLRREIVDSYERNNKQFTYESIQEMKYLNQVLEETLRLYPPATSVSRLCVEDYKIPGFDVTIEKGTTVVTSIMGIHYDPDFYPDPTKFDPERFTDENKASRPSYTHLPFGEGPRSCIGMRFGMLQSKMGLAAMLRKYIFRVNKRTIEPFEYNERHIILTVKHPIWLDAAEV